MKKNLLVIAAAMLVALGANAQKPVTSQRMAPRAALNMQKAEPAMSKISPSRTMKKVAKAGENGIFGTYIMNYGNLEADFTKSSVFTIESAEGTIKIFDEEGELTQDFTYNVVLNDFTVERAKVYGLYDATEGYIYIPVQDIGNSKTVYGASSDYGDVIFSAAIPISGEYIYPGLDMILLVNEDGSLEIDGGDWSEYIESGKLPENSAITGFCNLLSDADGAWNYGFECEFFSPNATIRYATTSAYLGGTGDGWEYVEKPVYVEDYSSELVINNFLGLAPVSVTADGDGTCYIPLPQYVDDYEYEDGGFVYGRMRIVGCLIDGESIKRDYSATRLNGFISEEGMQFFKTEYRDEWTDEDGEVHEAGDYLTDDDPNYIRYFAIATGVDQEGGAYGMGWCANLALRYYNETGIKGVKSNDSMSSNKIYNLMGQEVKSMGKGMFISNGKKFILK